MHSIDLIRQTLDALFTQYRHYGKNTFALSLNVLIILSLVIAALVVPIFLLMDFLGVGTNYGLSSVWDQIYLPESMYRTRLQNLAYAVNLFGMAVFGYYLLRQNPEASPLKSTRDVFDHIPRAQVPLLLMLLGGYLLFYLIGFPYLFGSRFDTTDGLLNPWDIAPEYVSLLHWLDSLLELLKGYVPLFLAFVLLVAFYEGNLANLKKYRSAMLAAFILLFVFDAAWLSLHNLFRTYFMGFVALPFPHMLLPTLIGFFAELALLAFFTVANAFVLVYPFHRVYRG